jgi:hypothetical protein
MAYPTLGEFEGVPSAYQAGASWVTNSAYEGGGYWSNEAGEKLSYAQLEKLWDDAGGNPDVAGDMAYIAEYDESGGYVGAWNSSGATGLWQDEWPSNYSGSRQQLFTPLTNAQVAVQLFDESGFSPWGSDPYESLNIPPASSVPGEDSPVTGGNDGSGGSASTTAASGSTGTTLGTLLGTSDLGDTFERLGLIVLGGALIVVGVMLLAGKQALKIAPMVA